MLGACHEPDPALNPGLSLGIAIATLAKAGRDKLTFLIDAEIASFGAWAEQLIAESTGKRGVGIVPVDLEPLGAVEAYGADRTFVRIALAAGRPGRARHARGCARGGGPPGHPDRAVGPDRPRRGSRPLGGRHGHRRDRARHRPVRPAQRRGGQAADPRRPRLARPPRTRDRRDRADRERRRPRPVRRRGPPADRRRRRRRGRAPAPPGAAPPGCLPVPAGLHRPDGRARRRPWHGSARCSATGPAVRRPPATARASSTRPASCTRAAPRSAGSSS